MPSLIEIVVQVSDRATRSLDKIETRLAALGVTSDLSAEKLALMRKELDRLPDKNSNPLAALARDGELFGRNLERNVRESVALREAINDLTKQEQRLRQARFGRGATSPFTPEERQKLNEVRADLKGLGTELEKVETKLKPFEENFALATRRLDQADRALSRLNLRAQALDLRHVNRDLQTAQINTQQIPRLLDDAAKALDKLGPAWSVAANTIREKSLSIRSDLFKAGGSVDARNQKFLQDTRDLRGAINEVAQGIRIADGEMGPYAARLEKAGDATFRTTQTTAALKRTIGDLIPEARRLGNLPLATELEKISQGFTDSAARALAYDRAMQRLSGRNAPPLAIIGRNLLQLRGFFHTTAQDVENFNKKLADTTNIDETVGRSFQIMAQRAIILGAGIFALIPAVGTAIGILDNLGAAAVSVGSALLQLGGVLATLPGFFAAAAGAAAGLLGVIQPLRLFSSASQLFHAQQQSGLKGSLGVGKPSGSAAKSAADAAKQTAQELSDAEQNLHNLKITDAQQEADAERRLQEQKVNGVRQLQQAEQALHDLRKQNAIDEQQRDADVQNARARLRGLRAEGASPAEIAAAQAGVREAVLLRRQFQAQADSAEHKAQNDVQNTRIQNIQQLKDAENALAETRRNNALQEKRAEQEISRLREQQIRQADTATHQTNTLFNAQALALAGLDKQQRKVVFTLVALRREFNKLTQPTRDAILAGFENFLIFLGDHLPQIVPLVDDFARRVAKIGGAFASWIEKPQNFNQVLEFFRTNAPIVSRMGDAAGHVADAIFRIAQTAQPLTDFVSKGIDKLASGLDRAANANIGPLGTFFRDLIPDIRTVVGIIGNIGDVLGHVITAAAPSGRELLRIFEGWTGQLDKTTGSIQGLQSMRNYFADQLPIFRKLADVTVTFFHDLQQVGDALTRPPGNGQKPFLLTFLDDVQQHLLPFLTRITTTFTQTLGPSVVNLFEQFGTALENIIKPGGPLKTLIDLLTNVLFAFNSIPAPIRDTIVQIAGIATVLKLINPAFVFAKTAIKGIIDAFVIFKGRAAEAGLAFAEVRGAANTFAFLLGGPLRSKLVLLLLFMPQLRTVLGLVADAFNAVGDALKPISDLLDTLPGPLHSLISETASFVALLIIPNAAVLGFKKFFDLIDSGFQRFLRAVGLGEAADELLARQGQEAVTEMEALTAAIEENTAALQGNQIATEETAAQVAALSVEEELLLRNLGLTWEQIGATTIATGELGASSEIAAVNIAAVGEAAAVATPEVEALGGAIATVEVEEGVGILGAIAGGFAAIGDALVTALPFLEGVSLTMGGLISVMTLGLPILLAFATNMFGIRDKTEAALGSIKDFVTELPGLHTSLIDVVGGIIHDGILGQKSNAADAAKQGIVTPITDSVVQGIKNASRHQIPQALSGMFIDAADKAQPIAIRAGLNVGQVMAQKMILGLKPISKGLPQALQDALNRAKTVATAQLNELQTEFDNFSSEAQQALGEIQGQQQTPAGKKLTAIEQKHQHLQDLADIHDAEATLRKAQASGDKTQILDAEKQLNDARYQLTVDRLSKQDANERKSLTKEQNNQLQTWKTVSGRIKALLLAGIITPAEASARMEKLRQKVGLTTHDVFKALGSKAAEAFDLSWAQIVKTAKARLQDLRAASKRDDPNLSKEQQNAAATLVADIQGAKGDLSDPKVKSDIATIKTLFTDAARARREIARAITQAIPGTVDGGKAGVLSPRGGSNSLLDSLNKALSIFKDPKVLKAAHDAGRQIGTNIGSAIPPAFRSHLQNFFTAEKLKPVLVDGPLVKMNAAIGAKSPAKKFFPIGQNIADGIVVGVKGDGSTKGLGEKLVDYFTKQLPKSFRTARDAFKPLWSGILSDTRSFFDDLMKTVRNGWESVLTYFTKTIPGSFGNIETGIGKLWTHLGKDVDTGWGYITGHLGKWAQNLVTIMSEVLHRVGAQKLHPLQLPTSVSSNPPTFASGGVPFVGTNGHGIVKPVPGGVFRMAEAGAPEAIVSLDPRHRDRSLRILKFAYNKIAGFADGGVTDPAKAGPRFAGLGIPHVPGFDGVTGLVKDIAVDAAKMLRTAVTQWFGTTLSGSLKGGGHVPSIAITAGEALANVGLGKQMAKAFGWGSGSQFDALYQLWAHESGWNQFAYNAGSGAQGIPQFLPGLPGRPTPPGFPSTPPVVSGRQIGWGLGYIHGSYPGGPLDAWTKWQARFPHWYHSGGIVPGQNENVAAVLRSREMVLTERQQAMLSRLVFGDTVPPPPPPPGDRPGRDFERVLGQTMRFIRDVFHRLSSTLKASSLPQFHVVPGDSSNIYTRTRLFQGSKVVPPGSRTIDVSKQFVTDLYHRKPYALGALIHEFAHAFQLGQIVERGPTWYEGGAEGFMREFGRVYDSMGIPFDPRKASVPRYAGFLGKLQGILGGAFNFFIPNQFGKSARQLRRSFASELAAAKKREIEAKKVLAAAKEKLKVYAKAHPHGKDLPTLRKAVTRDAKLYEEAVKAYDALQGRGASHPDPLGKSLRAELIHLDDARIIARNQLAEATTRLADFNATGASGPAADAIRRSLQGAKNRAAGALAGANRAYDRFIRLHPGLANQSGSSSAFTDPFGGRISIMGTGSINQQPLSFAGGGAVPGSMMGRPVGITAHVGEWVVNAEQQQRLAAVLGGWENAKQFLFNRMAPDFGQMSFARGGPILAGSPSQGRDKVVEQNVTINTASPRVDIDYVTRVMEQRMGRW